jgi:hypothetical protein
MEKVRHRGLFVRGPVRRGPQVLSGAPRSSRMRIPRGEVTEQKREESFTRQHRGVSPFRDEKDKVPASPGASPEDWGEAKKGGGFFLKSEPQ